MCNFNKGKPISIIFICCYHITYSLSHVIILISKYCLEKKKKRLNNLLLDIHPITHFYTFDFSPHRIAYQT